MKSMHNCSFGFRQHGSIRSMRVLFCAVFLFTLFLMCLPACAGTVAPSGRRDSTDRMAIQRELDSSGNVTLQSGGTYFLDIALRLNSNQTIIADGATIILRKAAARNATDNIRPDYGSMSNVLISGGTWLSESPDGLTGTTFSFAHSNRIRLLNLNMACTNPEAHAIEVIACDDVIIQGCTIVPQGSGKANGQQEMVQIDLATPLTAPFLDNASLQNGLACKNISVLNCSITGSRALCCNYAAKESKYKKYYHQNIVIKNNTLIGQKAEALALFNTLTADVEGNTIICYSSRVKTAYSIGLHVALFGKAKIFKKKANIRIVGNVIKGGRQALHILSHAKVKYKKVTVKNNKLYCRKGKKQALSISTVSKVKKSNNKTYKWKGN